MFDDKGMLTDRARGMLFWFTISMIGLLIIVVIVFIVNLLIGQFSPPEPDLVILPAEVSLCPGQHRQFTVEGDAEVVWDATGGDVSQSGSFTAGNAVGDYEVTVTGRDSRQTAKAVVHIIECPATATPVPTAAPTATPTPEPATPAPADAQGDVGAYETGALISGVPAGIDISAASVQADLRVALQPTAGLPAGLAEWAAEGDVLLWVSLYEPVPDPPGVYTNWIFVLDVDGNTGTGRPPRTRRINPDLGDEVVVGFQYSEGAYSSYSYVWNTGTGGWVDGPTVRHYMDESRTLIALAVPLDGLSQALSQAGSAAIVPDAVNGRAAAESYVGEQRVIDFYPDLP